MASSLPTVIASEVFKIVGPIDIGALCCVIGIFILLRLSSCPERFFTREAVRSHERRPADATVSVVGASRNDRVLQLPPGTSCSPQELLQHFGPSMSASDKIIVNNYPAIFYYKVRTPPSGPKNGGYDDKDWHYILEVDEHLAFRFQVKKLIAKGAFGQVIRCYDHMSEKMVAVKMLQNVTFCKNASQCYWNEKDINKYLQKMGADRHPNVANVISSFHFHNHGCFVMDFMPMNLYEAILKFDRKSFNLEKVRQYTQSILHGLSFLKSCGIVHADLKPENILVENHISGKVRLADFGLSVHETQRLCRRFGTVPYMAPEMMILNPVTSANDMWALGCITVDMLFGHSLFGGDKRKLLKEFIEMLGLPPQSFIIASKGMIVVNGDKVIVGEHSIVVNKNALFPRLQYLGNDQFLDFLQRCFTWESALRLTPQEGLDHPWIKGTIPPALLPSTAVLAPPTPACEQEEKQEVVVEEENQEDARVSVPVSPRPRRRRSRVQHRLRKMLRPVKRHCCCGSSVAVLE